MIRRMAIVAVGLSILLSAGAAGAAVTVGLSGTILSRPFPGFVVVSQGPLTAAQFASYSPDPAATAALLGRLTRTGGARTYRRAWTDTGFHNGVTDLVVVLDGPAAATAYRNGQRAALATVAGATVSGVPGIPGGRRYAYPVTSPVVGAQQVVVVTAGSAVATVTLAAAAASNPHPLTAADADAVARRQYRALRAAGFGPRPPAGVSGLVLAGWVVLAAAAALAATCTVSFWRSRRRRSIRP